MQPFKLMSLAILVCSMPSFGQEKIARIRWEDDVMEAFVKAIETNRPMVVLFVSNTSYRSPEGGNISNEARKVFESAKLQELANEAVFVLCTFDHTQNTIHDEFGKRIYQRLNIELVPTLCMFAPRTDFLQEVCHVEGIRTAETYAAELKVALSLSAKAVDSEVSQPNAPPTPPALAPNGGTQKIELPAPATPAEAINQLSRALQAGDISDVANLLAAPYVQLYSNTFSAAHRLGVAKRRILAAMDGRFGVGEDSVPYGEDDARVRKGMQHVSAVVLEEAHYPEMKLCVVRARMKFADGMSKSVEVRVVREENGWRIQPEEWLGFTDQERCRRHAEFLNRLADDFALLAQNISAGEFSSRSACQSAARELFLSNEKRLDVRHKSMSQPVFCGEMGSAKRGKIG